MTEYDHNRNAGNEGDVVKHVALMAALEAIFVRWNRRRDFRFADTFAGHAHNPLRNGAGWTHGIAVVRDRLRQGRWTLNPTVRRWCDWYVRTARPSHEGGMYPGSCQIALDVAARADVRLRLTAWDISRRAVENLRTILDTSIHSVVPRPAKRGDPRAKKADFLFIDPPNLEAWKYIVPFLTVTHPNILIWLPVPPRTCDEYGEPLRPPEEAAESERIRNVVLKKNAGFHATRVRWSAGGRGAVGCQLLYRLPDRARMELEKAVRAVVNLAGWNPKLPPGWRTVRHY